MADPGFVDLPGTTHFSFSFNQELNVAGAMALGSTLAATNEQDFSTMAKMAYDLLPKNIPN